MKTFKPTSLILTACTVAISLPSSAASFDVRHEYKNHTEQHSTRVKMGDSIGNFYFSGELKFKGADGDFMKDLKNNGWELDLGYRYKVDGTNWTIQPGMPIEGRESGMTYKPQLRATYEFESVAGLNVSARYRYDIKTYSTGESTDLRHRLTANVNYAYADWRFGFEGNYYNADGYELYNNTKEDYELNLTARRVIGSWAPYVEFGDVSTSPEKSTRELRSRVGVTYSF
ncbi:N-acetylneuraminic acid outer membrane channel protein NanC [Vibrio breoganii]|uniref:oligogalacturonate-specific porin KdgM family protein n=1 Tax=Vibrio breoganii TaxID=553239 RepID=UPI000C816797|nr:oligogalacturonate-specific porin KdgM family protein [Vibrio breoganii]PMK28735.1 N-acetylneuraminic acid outer membrane channel protein NanC [Vibrio breoganii]PMO64398.1 N-acetylneuraminic acid outer membrane channel protein NanC [Vibrio breoganii]